MMEISKQVIFIHTWWHDNSSEIVILKLTLELLPDAIFFESFYHELYDFLVVGLKRCIDLDIHDF